jgi:hypothetical protein
MAWQDHHGGGLDKKSKCSRTWWCNQSRPNRSLEPFGPNTGKNHRNPKKTAPVPQKKPVKAGSSSKNRAIFAA